MSRPTARLIEPTVRWVNPLRRRIARQQDGTWSATYRQANHTTSVGGCKTRREARGVLTHMLRLRLVEIDGRFYEVIE